MQEKNDYQRISVKVFAQEAPELRTVKPKFGPNAGKDIPLMTLKVWHRNVKRNPDGTFEQGQPDFYTVKSFGTAAPYLAKRIQKGMYLTVEGALLERTWTGKDGEPRLSREITADDILLSLRQVGIRSVDFERREAPKREGPER